MIVYIIALLTLLPMYLILHFNYMSSATKNSSSQYLAVQISPENQEDSDFVALLREYRTKIRTVTWVSVLVFLIAVQLLLVPVISDYVLTFMALLLLSIFLPMTAYNRVLYRYRQRLLDLKEFKDWKITNTGKVYADLATSRLKNRNIPKEYLFLLPALLSLGIFLAYGNNFGMTLLFLTNLFIHLIFWGAFRVVKHMPAKMYSTDTEVNLLLNQAYRRNWAYTYLGLSFIQCIFMFALAAIAFRFIQEPDYAMSGYFIGTIVFMSLFPIAIVFILYLRQRQKEQSFLNKQNTFIGEDEDCYYEPHGIWGLLYNNPYNNAVTIPRPYGIGQTVNIATKKGYFYFQFGKWVTILAFVFVTILVCFEDFVPPAIHVAKDEITIFQTLYPLKIHSDEIESIEWKDDNFANQAFYKNVGSATNRYLRGTFSAKGNPSIRLYVFRHKPYVLFHIKNKEYAKLYFNHANPAKTAQLFQTIQEKMPEKITKTADNEENNKEKIPENEAKNKVSSDKGIATNQSQNPITPEHRQAFQAAEEDYSVPAGNGKLHAVLNLPKNPDSNIPVALIIGGSGPSTKEGIANLYLDLAAQLCDNGIAVIRYDKRGIARSESVIDARKDEDKMVIEDFVGDVVKLLEKAAKDSRFSDIYILGHSEGALVGTLAAEQEEISGLICLAGAGRNIAEITLEQIKANPANPKDLITASERILNHLLAGETTEDVPALLQPLFRLSVQPYMISWMKYDPAAELAKLDIPILILQGDNDSQVQVIDAENLHQAAPKSNMRIIPKMTHMLKDSDISKDEAFKNPMSAMKYTKVYADDSLPLNSDLIQEMVHFIMEDSHK